MTTMRSLQGQGHHLSDTFVQLDVLNNHHAGIPPFGARMEAIGLSPLKPTAIDTLQVNIGKMCNQTCKHCHVDAGPDRKEMMTREIMEHCLDILRHHAIPTVDITGGAPEMHPEFRWFVGEIRKLGKHIIDRCNLTIIRANKKYHDLPDFLARHEVGVVSSLPHYVAGRTDRQRGDGVFEASIEALTLLNRVGYGQEDSSLQLNLVYNPTGAFLPGDQQQLEADFKRILKEQYQIDFNNLYAITNMPISRFLDYLLSSGNYQAYMEKLLESFNPAAAQGLMCRNTLSVSWDGYLYDCDFNQMLDMKVNTLAGPHIKDFDLEALTDREIRIDQHCYGCTAGAGSSCGGETV